MNLLISLDETTRRMDEGKAVEVFYLEFNKANSISHFLLDHEMPALDMPKSVRHWVKRP